MTDIPLRDLIAMQAMNGLISSDGGIEKLKKATNMLLAQGENVEGTDIVALVSYELADAMLRRREVVETSKAKSTGNKGFTEHANSMMGGHGNKKILTIESGER